MSNSEEFKAQVLQLKVNAYGNLDSLMSWYEANNHSSLSLNLKTQNEIKLNKVFGKILYIVKNDFEAKDIGKLNMILDEMLILMTDVENVIKLA
jgi:hypothetical protein